MFVDAFRLLNRFGASFSSADRRSLAYVVDGRVFVVFVVVVADLDSF